VVGSGGVWTGVERLGVLVLGVDIMIVVVDFLRYFAPSFAT